MLRKEVAEVFPSTRGQTSRERIKHAVAVLNQAGSEGGIPYKATLNCGLVIVGLRQVP